MSRQIVSTNVRFDLEKEPDRTAWEYLRQRDKRQYHSYSRAVIAAINDRRPQERKCFTEKYGTHQCMLAVRESLLKLYGSTADETIRDQVLRHGTANISERYLSEIQSTARDYVAGICRRLREHEYDPELMKLYIVGGGGCLIKNFGQFEAGRVVINEDICATAKGYEYLARLRARKGGTV